MFEVRQVYLVAGKAEGVTPLNAFDNALLNAGIGDANLVKVSSIVPPGTKVTLAKPNLPSGAFVPCVYAECFSETKGEKIAAAVVVGLADDGFGVVMESNGKTAEEAITKAKFMVEEAFRVRGLRLAQTFQVAAEHQIEHCGSCVAACVYWR